MMLPEAKLMTRAQAPVIDVSALFGDTPGVRQDLAHRIATVCREIGFFYIVNHGVPAASVAAMFDAAAEFFALPFEAKMEVSITLSRDYRGYLPIRMIGDGAELKGNLYESFHVWPDCRREAGTESPARRARGPNQWPRRMPALENLMLGYAAHMNRLAVELARILALGLDLAEDAFLRFFTDPIALLRFLHYPPQEADSNGRLGLRPHTDAGAFAILAQDDIGGLEILGRDGEWIAVPPVADSFVINLGEMMKIWSDGIFTATPHRVINRYGDERYSIPFFYYADFDAPLRAIVRNPAPTDEPLFYTSIARDEPITAGEHLARIHRKIWPNAELQRII